jgi:hypothetical protein
MKDVLGWWAGSNQVDGGGDLVGDGDVLQDDLSEMFQSVQAPTHVKLLIVIELSEL